MSDDRVIVSVFGLEFRASPDEAAYLLRRVQELEEQAAQVAVLLADRDQALRKNATLERHLSVIDTTTKAIRRDLNVDGAVRLQPRRKPTRERSHA